MTRGDIISSQLIRHFLVATTEYCRFPCNSHSRTSNLARNGDTLSDRQKRTWKTTVRDGCSLPRIAVGRLSLSVAHRMPTEDDEVRFLRFVFAMTYISEKSQE